MNFNQILRFFIITNAAIGWVIANMWFWLSIIKITFGFFGGALIATTIFLPVILVDWFLTTSSTEPISTPTTKKKDA